MAIYKGNSKKFNIFFASLKAYISFSLKAGNLIFDEIWTPFLDSKKPFLKTLQIK